MMLILIGASVAGCATSGAPKDECRGREPYYPSAQVVAAMTRQEKERVVAWNEQLERECGAKPVRRW